MAFNPLGCADINAQDTTIQAEFGHRTEVVKSEIDWFLAISQADPAGSHYLYSEEVTRIQSVVDRLGQDIVVVGSAAAGNRRNAGTSFPLGKKPNEKSDIDYLIPLRPVPGLRLSWKLGEEIANHCNEKNRNLIERLPDINLKHGIIFYEPDPGRNRIWFKPHEPRPLFLASGQPNPQVPTVIDLLDDNEVLTEVEKWSQRLIELELDAREDPAMVQSFELAKPQILQLLQALRGEQMRRSCSKALSNAGPQRLRKFEVLRQNLLLGVTATSIRRIVRQSGR
jgi:hypothetical protein